MNIGHLILREILFRKGNFLLAVLAVVAAVGCLVAELTMLRLYDQATEQALAQNQSKNRERIKEESAKANIRLVDEKKRTKKRLDELEDDFRKIMKNLGFNVVILNEKEDLRLMKERGYAKEEMPESYAKKLANSPIMTINHLLPILQQKVLWPEKKINVLLTGVEGNVTLVHRKKKKKQKLMKPVPKGKMVVGNLIHKSLGLSEGQIVTFKGKEFEVIRLMLYRGRSYEDLAVWVNLEDAQEVLDKKGRINAIQALECNCDSPDRLGDIRREVGALLPNTQVIDLHTDALVRADARNRARKEALDALAQKEQEILAALAHEKTKGEAALTAEQKSRDEVREQLTALASLLIPLVLLGAIVWLGLMTLTNVHQRQTEIGILRALGLSSGSVYLLFVSRAVIVGLLGAIIGYGFGIGAGLLWAQGDVPVAAETALFNPALLLIVLAATPLLCALVGWMSAMLAARQDPAVILQHA